MRRQEKSLKKILRQGTTNYADDSSRDCPGSRLHRHLFTALYMIYTFGRALRCNSRMLRWQVRRASTGLAEQEAGCMADEYK